MYRGIYNMYPGKSAKEIMERPIASRLVNIEDILSSFRP